MNRKAAIGASGLGFRYADGTEALSDMSFKITEGEFCAILAANGSGKTTLIKTLAGLLKPLAGSLQICGENIRDLPQEKLYSRIGVMFQNPDDQLFSSTVYEDVAFGPRNIGHDEAEVRRRVEEALGNVHAERLAGKTIHNLSFGEKKRVALAGVLAMRPSILLLDEPTAGMDPAGEAAVMRLLGEINRAQGVTIVMATHAVDAIPGFVDSVIVLSGGKMLSHGPAEEILANHEMMESAGLRLPYVAMLARILRDKEGLSLDELPLTVESAGKAIIEAVSGEVARENAETGR